MDPFVFLGVEPTMDLDPAELERRYLKLSRETHPDFHRVPPEQQSAVLARSARLNDAYRQLVDPWSRATKLLELRSPGAMERNKQLCPIFLAEAMELTEDVRARPDDQTLASKLRREIEQYLRKISDHLESGKWDAAARELHESRYYRKALKDLKDPK